jgi:adenosylcobinamide-GDP ribazoletransferase
MRDSRIGTYGAAALILSLLLRVALLSGLTAAGAARALLVGHVVGRATGLVMGARLQPVRTDGRGTDIHGPFTVGQVAVAGAVTLLALVAGAGTSLAVPVAAAAISYGIMERLARTRLGGFTGDVLGATTQVAHIASMACVVALIQMEVPWWAI